MNVSKISNEFKYFYHDNLYSDLAETLLSVTSIGVFVNIIQEVALMVSTQKSLSKNKYYILPFNGSPLTLPMLMLL